MSYSVPEPEGEHGLTSLDPTYHWLNKLEKMHAT